VFVGENTNKGKGGKGLILLSSPGYAITSQIRPNLKFSRAFSSIISLSIGLIK
jgi:hypothetical protein